MSVNARGWDKRPEQGKPEQSRPEHNAENKYGDILLLPRPVSKYHPPMPIGARAAQFAPFAALTGYEDEVEKTARQHIADVEAEVSHIACDENGEPEDFSCYFPENTT